jgi:hypothetical protein
LFAKIQNYRLAAVVGDPGEEQKKSFLTEAFVVLINAVLL